MNHYLVSMVPNVGELMLASYNLSNQIDCKDWYSLLVSLLFFMLTVERWTSEKYDGLRACWNPLNERLNQHSIFFSFA